MKKIYCKPVISVHEIASLGMIASSATVGIHNNTLLDASSSLSRDGGAHNSTWDFEW
ncbi:MAG: hypothetical protein IKW22_02330 [Bacteroidaceae bacterium]|nr:hypothetical protein [Bacteroidaceae bacterium]